MPNLEGDEAEPMAFPPVTRREFLLTGTAAMAVAALPRRASAQTAGTGPLQPVMAKVALTVKTQILRSKVSAVRQGHIDPGASAARNYRTGREHKAIGRDKHSRTRAAARTNVHNTLNKIRLE